VLSPERKRYVAIMSLIGSGHGVSHFHLLALPPLFPVLKDAFDVSYAALGLLVTLMNLAAGLVQLPAGFLVDRLGAPKVLIAGLALSGLSIALIGLAPSYWVVLILVVLAGIGNSVFHPADYAILNTSIEPSRLGRAFAMHTFTGNLGFVAAPTTMILLSSLFGWRVAVGIAGGLALVIVILVQRYGYLLMESGHDASAPGPARKSRSAGIGPILTLAVVAMFIFFILVSMVTSGMQSFSVAALVTHQGTGLAAANTILTAFLVAGACGVLLGGPLADRTTHHAKIAAGALLGSAILLLLVGQAQLPYLVLIAVFVAVGLMQGVVRPSRDMMVRAVTPPGATGRVFGFVSAGLNLGGAVTPLLFGYMIDLGHARWVFVFMSLILVLGIATIAIVKAQDRPLPAPAE
jgi:MFS family permease